MENKKITHWSIAVCEDANEDREMFEEDGEEYEVVRRGISVYGHKVEDNTVRAASSLTKQEIDSFNQVLGQERQLLQNPILDISDKFRKAADEVYKKFKLPFGHKGYVFKNEGLGNIEFYTEVDVERQNIQFYGLIKANEIVKLLNFPLSSPLYLAAKLHDLAFEIEYYAPLQPTTFTQMRLLEIGIEAGRVERNLNDELASHFDTMNMNKGKGRTAKEVFNVGLSPKKAEIARIENQREIKNARDKKILEFLDNLKDGLAPKQAKEAINKHLVEIGHKTIGITKFYEMYKVWKKVT